LQFSTSIWTTSTLNNQRAQLDSMQEAFKLNGGKLWGYADPAAFTRLVEFLAAAKQIDKTMPAKDLIVGIPDFYATRQA
jgi:NitT/TauT family transport system substrate-binding protein